ncbi:TetR/AcrR family transcriptional regulator [Pseudomonas paraversuta]|uniref:TetR/AcrR family transcriptional regulator n=1 Tax=Pseudomonas paraversuta TaxID=2750624 RepID=UPI003D2E7A9C
MQNVIGRVQDRHVAWPLSLPISQAATEVSTRQLLRQVALQLFVEQGFHSVSLRQLAATMRLQAGSLYNHIESKQALLFELIEEHESDLLALLATQASRRSNSPLQLETCVRLQLQFNCQHEQRHILARLEFRSLSDEQKLRVVQLRKAQTLHLENILARCALPPHECTPMALGLQALLDGVITGYPGGVRPPLNKLVALFSRMLLSGLPPEQVAVRNR